MDAKDSSSSSLAAVRDGPVEEEGLLSVREGLAKEAAHLFQSRRFSECVDVLNQIQQKREEDDRKDDLKVRHNIAIAEFFRDGCSDPRKLLLVLNEVKNKSEYLVRTSGDQMGIASSRGSNINSGSRGNCATLLQLSNATTGSLAFADEFDTSIVTFNIAVILYHLHEYKCALSVLWQLYQNIEPIDEAISLHVCLLLLDIALASQDASKAEDVIHYLEKSFGGAYLINQGDNGSITQQQSLNQGLKISATSNIALQDASISDSSTSVNVSESPLVETLSDDAYENLYSTLDSGGQNLGRPALNDLSKTSADRVAPAIDLKLKLHLYKVRLLLLTRNQKDTKREIKLAINDVRGRDSSTELLLKSQLEYGRGNHSKAIRLLEASGNRTEASMQIIYDNNLGCIFHQLGIYYSSNYLFSKALRTSLSLLSEKPRKLSTFSQDKSRLIMYNCGLQALVLGNPLPAAHCFSKVAPMFDDRPLFWLRSAECCLLALKKGLLRPSSASSSGEEIIKLHVIGSGRWRQLAVDDADLTNRYSKSAAHDGSLGGDKSILSLPFARQCLLKALLLLDNFEPIASKSAASAATSEATSLGVKNSSSRNATGGDPKASNPTSASTPADDSKETKGCLASSTTLRSSVVAYEDICRKENHMIKQAALADLAYVQLCLEEPLSALSKAKLLQQIPGCSRTYIFLSRVYAAEAFCHLDRLQEAAEQLTVYFGDENNVELPYSDDDRERWSAAAEDGDGEEPKGCSMAAKTTPKDPQDWAAMKPEEARGTLYANLASVFAMKGDLEQAGRFALEALSSFPSNPRAMLAAVYVDLRQGKAQDALSKLRQSRHVRFLQTGVTSLSSS